MGWDRPFYYNYTIDVNRVSSHSSSPAMGWDRPFDYNHAIDGYRVVTILALPLTGTGLLSVTTPSMTTE